MRCLIQIKKSHRFLSYRVLYKKTSLHCTNSYYSSVYKCDALPPPDAPAMVSSPGYSLQFSRMTSTSECYESIFLSTLLVVWRRKLIWEFFVLCFGVWKTIPQFTIMSHGCNSFESRLSCVLEYAKPFHSSQ